MSRSWPTVVEKRTFGALAGRPDDGHKRDLKPLFGYGTNPDSAFPEGKTVLHGFECEQLYPFYYVVWPEEAGRCWCCPLIE
jgi:hypothetical protein